MNLTIEDFYYLGYCLEGFFFGLYSGIFALYLQYHSSKKETDNATQNIFYALCVLYVLSVALIALDIAIFLATFTGSPNLDKSMAYRFESIMQPVVCGFCDFIAQSILIYRCWIVWGRNIYIAFVPSILAFAFLVTWIVPIDSQSKITSSQIGEISWSDILILTSLTASMTVNALTTGLIVFRIYKVFSEVKGSITSNDKSLGITRGSRLRSIMFIIIESGMALFAIQLARVVITTGGLSIGAKLDTLSFIVSVHVMLNGITPTIILVRVSMGLSFHDEPSLVEAVRTSQFAADHPNPMLGTGHFRQDGDLYIEPDELDPIPVMVNISQERRDDISGSDDIEIVNR